MIARAILLLLLAPLLSAAQASPRAVSLDYCADQYLLALAAPEQIAAVSRGGVRDYAYLREAARAYPRIRPVREEAFAKAPDVILRQWGGGPNAEQAYARFSVRVISLGFPNDFEGVKDNIRIAAAALDRTAEGEALIHDLDARLASLAQTAATEKTRALYVTPGGVTAGARTMIDAIMQAAGVSNIAAEAGHDYWPPLSAEALLLDPPGFIVAGFFESDDEAINHWSAARHPALERMLDRTPGVRLPADVLSCAGPHSVVAAEMVAQAIRAEHRSSVE